MEACETELHIRDLRTFGQPLAEVLGRLLVDVRGFRDLPFVAGLLDSGEQSSVASDGFEVVAVGSAHIGQCNMCVHGCFFLVVPELDCRGNLNSPLLAAVSCFSDSVIQCFREEGFQTLVKAPAIDLTMLPHQKLFP